MADVQCSMGKHGDDAPASITKERGKPHIRQSWHAFCFTPRAPDVASDQGRGLELEQGPAMRMSGTPGPVVGGLPALFSARKNTAAPMKKPGIAGPCWVPTSGGAGTGGIQISPPNVDIEACIVQLRQKAT
jgi:hypothetical protein